MNPWQHAVLEFHQKFGAHVEWVPRYPPDRIKELRCRLIDEESTEAIDAIYETQDLEDIAKELADLIYVTVGTAVSFGIDLDPVFAEVHRSNMDKVSSDSEGRIVSDSGGKILKPEGWRPPNIREIINRQLGIS